MLRYAVVRLFQGAIVIFLISLATFAIMRLMPGDPVYLLLGEGEVRISEEQIEAIRERWGLNDPYHVQYFTWVRNMATGNFGESLIRQGTPVRDMIFQSIPVTIELNAYALLIALLIALPVGVWAGVRPNSAIDYSTSVGSALGIAMPNFWLGLMLIALVAANIEALPTYGLRSWHGYVLPVIVLATEQMAVLTRVMRSSTLEVMSQDYVRTARSKGLTERVVVARHAIRNALLPIVTVIGFRIAFLLSGTIIVETVFAIPGVGRLFTDSVFRLDYQVVQSLAVIFAVLVVLINLLTDLVYAVIDPRIRYD